MQSIAFCSHFEIIRDYFVLVKFCLLRENVQILRQTGQTQFLNSVHVCVFYETTWLQNVVIVGVLFSSSLNLFLSLERGSWRNYDDGAESVHFFGMPFMHLGFNKGERERERRLYCKGARDAIFKRTRL